MKTLTLPRIPLCLIVLALLINPGVTRAQNFNYRSCAWPLLLSPEGSGNVQGPDGGARYWIMPFDTTQYPTATISGAYPNIRYFSFAAYETTSTGFHLVTKHLYDAQIAPDPGTVNPFVPPQTPAHGRGVAMHSDSANGTYTVVISATAPASGNTITVASGTLVWIALRMYLPNDDPSETGQTLMGGVPLPTITLTDQSGARHQLDTCSPINKWQDMSDFARFLFPPTTPLDLKEGTPYSDRLWFAPIQDPPSNLWPNPDNKYMMMWPGDQYQSGRIIVIHGKAPGFPGTYNGSPVWVPSRGFRNIDMRYWAVCEQDLALPLSLISCVTDFNANIVGNYYTIVISDDLARPKWLRPEIDWLPYGDEQYPKFVILRNMLPASSFDFSIQKAWDDHCTFNFSLLSPPDRSAIDVAGSCAEGIMHDYYPVAVWCNKSTFQAGGFQACVKED